MSELPDIRPSKSIPAPNWRDCADVAHSPIYRGLDLNRDSLGLIIGHALAELPEAVPIDSVTDLTHCEPQAIIGMLNHLTLEANLVLHGGKTKQLLTELDPAYSMQQHHKTPVVNATTDAAAAAYYAVISYEGLYQHLPPGLRDVNFGVGLSNYLPDGQHHFEIQCDANMYKILNAHASDEDIFTSGYVYVLDRSDFNPSSLTPGQQRSDHEWSATNTVVPLATFRLPPAIGHQIVTPSSIVWRHDL